MFTGIIQEIGIIKEFNKISDKLYEIKINCSKILSDMKFGESIAVNGVCLTVKDFDNSSFTSEIMSETLNKTNFKNLKIKYVNLEKSLKLSDRLDGHIVLGHIDGIGRLSEINKVEGDYIIKISAEKDILNNIVFKGSIAINGVSLTIVECGKEWVSVSLIPSTINKTNFKYLNENDIVNLETDVIGKYVQKYLIQNSDNRKSKITNEFLLKNF